MARKAEQLQIEEEQEKPSIFDEDFDVDNVKLQEIAGKADEARQAEQNKEDELEAEYIKIDDVFDKPEQAKRETVVETGKKKTKLEKKSATRTLTEQEKEQVWDSGQVRRMTQEEVRQALGEEENDLEVEEKSTSIDDGDWVDSIKQAKGFVGKVAAFFGRDTDQFKRENDFASQGKTFWTRFRRRLGFIRPEEQVQEYQQNQRKRKRRRQLRNEE